jgi:hypothetical protein
LPVTRAESPNTLISEEDSSEAALHFRSPKTCAVPIWAKFDSATKVMAKSGGRSKPASVRDFFHREHCCLQQVFRPPHAQSRNPAQWTGAGRLNKSPAQGPFAHARPVCQLRHGNGKGMICNRVEIHNGWNCAVWRMISSFSSSATRHLKAPLTQPALSMSQRVVGRS